MQLESIYPADIPMQNESIAAILDCRLDTFPYIVYISIKRSR